MAGYLNEFIANLPLVCQRKNFENRLTFGEVMGKSLMSRFLTHGVVLLSLNSQRSLVCMFNKNSLFCTYSFTQHLWATQSSSIHHDIGTTYTHIRITALCPETTHVSRYQKVPIWILLKQETVSGSGISWAICKSAPRSRQITTSAPHHSVSTGRMPFLPPNRQCQSTEGTIWTT